MNATFLSKLCVTKMTGPEMGFKRNMKNVGMYISSVPGCVVFSTKAKAGGFLYRNLQIISNAVSFFYLKTISFLG